MGLCQGPRHRRCDQVRHADHGQGQGLLARVRLLPDFHLYQHQDSSGGTSVDQSVTRSISQTASRSSPSVSQSVSSPSATQPVVSVCNAPASSLPARTPHSLHACTTTSCAARSGPTAASLTFRSPRPSPPPVPPRPAAARPAPSTATSRPSSSSAAARR